MNLENISKFEEYIKKNYKSKHLLSSMKKPNVFKTSEDDNLRMTILELI